MSDIDYTNISAVLGKVIDLLNVPKPPDPPIALPVVLLASDRTGLSAQEMGAEVIRRRAEAGLPVGALPDGSVNPAEVMEIIRMQVIIEYLTTKMRNTVAIEPGITLAGYGTTASGEPVIIQGLTTGIGNGTGIVQ